MKQILTTLAALSFAVCVPSVRADCNPKETARLSPSDAEGWPGLGVSVAVSDGTAVIGAPSDTSACSADPYSCYSGSAYVFTDNGSGSWAQQAELTASDVGACGFSGVTAPLPRFSVVSET